MALVIDEQGYAAWQAEREATRARRERAAASRARASQQRESELQSLADSLGVLRDSRTFAQYLAGDIDRAEAQRIGEITSHRHECTDYDDLLSRGYSRDDARALAQQTAATI
jgi:hypothetical protein